MQTKITKQEGLIREISAELDINEFNTNINDELNKLGKTVKINGFRDGKVPLNVVKQKFGKSVRYDVANKMIEKSLPDVFAQEKLSPAATPDLIKLDTEDKDALKFTVRFEVFPDIKLKPINELTIEVVKSEVTDDDLNTTLEDIKKQNASFSEVDRQSAKGDKLSIDFLGKIDDKEFSGSNAENFELILGDNNMVAGFEDGLIAKKAGDKTTVEVVFPDNYQVATIAGKKATFAITINKVFDVEIPELTDEIIAKYNEKNVADFTKSAKKHMVKDLEDILDKTNTEAVFSALLDNNDIEVPEASVEGEAQNMLRSTLEQQKQQGQAVSDNLHASMFYEQAKKRIKLGLFVAEIAKTNAITVAKEQIKDRISQIAVEHNQEEKTVMDWYYEDASRLSGIELMLLENKVVEYIINTAQTTIVNKTLKELNANRV